jgi:hypothetical protein
MSLKVIFFSLLLTLVVFIGAFAWALVSGAKAEDEAMQKALDEYLETRECTRHAPHVCKVNGPCNGLPKSKETK